MHVLAAGESLALSQRTTNIHFFRANGKPREPEDIISLCAIQLPWCWRLGEYRYILISDSTLPHRTNKGYRVPIEEIRKRLGGPTVCDVEYKHGGNINHLTAFVQNMLNSPAKYSFVVVFWFCNDSCEGQQLLK